MRVPKPLAAQKPQNNKPAPGCARLVSSRATRARRAGCFLVVKPTHNHQLPSASEHNVLEHPRHKKGSTRGPLTVLLFRPPRLPPPWGRSRSDHPQRPRHLRPASAGTSPRLTVTFQRLRRTILLSAPRRGPKHLIQWTWPARSRPAPRVFQLVQLHAQPPPPSARGCLVIVLMTPSPRRA